MPSTATKTSRLETRVSPEARETLVRAAEIEGRSVSDFVVAAALDAAKKVIAETQIISLSREASAQFARALISPPVPNDALKRAASNHNRLITLR